MRRIAFLTSVDMMPGHPDRRADYFEFDLEFALLKPACAARGFSLEPQIWDVPIDWHVFEAAMIGTTWDYPERQAEFLAALEQIASQTRLLNPLEVVRWNLRKTYLQDLAASGAPGVPTLWTADARPTTIQAAFVQLGADELVVKPQIGAGAWRQARVRQGDPLPPATELPPAEAMIQPYLPAITTEGEYSLLFYGGVFSHGVRKMPKAGDYRVQSMYGATETPFTPSPAELAAARAVLDAVPATLRNNRGLLYARVDMVRGLGGELLLMELELIEPYHYPEQGPGLGAVFAAALDRVLAE